MDATSLIRRIQAGRDGYAPIGLPQRFAVVTDDGQVVAVGAGVATEAENVVLNCYRNFWKGLGHLKVMSNHIKVS